MIHPALCIALVLGLLGGSLLLAQSLTIAAELKRKLIHITLGLGCLGFPWIFNTIWPVLLLCASSIATLILIRRTRSSLRSTLHGVNRKSWGEICFPLSVAGLFLLQEDPVTDYVLPLLILTLADAVGALVGVRFGRAKYTTDEGFKSLEGSMAFFVVTFICTFFCVRMAADSGTFEALLIATIVGILVMLIEGFSRTGFDNLWIPFVSYILIHTYIEMDAASLGARFLLLCGIIAFFVLLRRRSFTRDSVLIASCLILYLIWATAGWTMALPPFTLALFYSFTCQPGRGQEFDGHFLDDLAAVCGAALLWLLLAVNQGFASYTMPFILSWVAQGGIIIASFMSWRKPEITRFEVALYGALVGLVLGAPTVFIQFEGATRLMALPYVIVSGATAAVALWVCEWERTGSTHSHRRAVRQFGYGLIISSIGFTFSIS